MALTSGKNMVFSDRRQKGDMANLTAILTPSKTKDETAVNIREEDGENTLTY